MAQDLAEAARTLVAPYTEGEADSGALVVTDEDEVLDFGDCSVEAFPSVAADAG